VITIVHAPHTDGEVGNQKTEIPDVIQLREGKNESTADQKNKIQYQYSERGGAAN